MRPASLVISGNPLPPPSLPRVGGSLRRLRLPRLRGATCMTLGGTDKKGGPWDRLSWHHAATFQCNHRRSRLTQLLSSRVLRRPLAPLLLLPPRRPLPFHFRDRPPLSPLAVLFSVRSLPSPCRSSFLATAPDIFGSPDLFSPMGLLFRSLVFSL